MAEKKEEKPRLNTDGMTVDEIRSIVDYRSRSTLPFMIASGLAIWWFVPTTFPSDDVIIRLVFTLRCLIPSAIMLLGLTLYCAFFRYNTDPKRLCTDPARATIPYKLEVANRVLRSSTELTVAHVILQLALCTLLGGETCARVILVFTIWFVGGRIIFFYGYMSERDPLNRAYGFSITVYGLICHVVLCIFLLVWNGPLSGISDIPG